ncbi:MAG: alkaline phosphatase family protein [Rickettsiales bacterium]|nr:alkaline phosphatase family protein [Rickettsiales bacterium]
MVIVFNKTITTTYCKAKKYLRTRSNKFIEFFSHKDYYSKEKVEVSQDFMKYKTVFDKISKKVRLNHIFPSFDTENGVENIDVALDKIEKLCNTKEEKFIHLYWDNPDLILHENGCDSKEANEFLNKINSKLTKITENLKDTIFIITADHGMIDIPKDNIINLNELQELTDCLVMPPSFKGQHYSFFVKHDKRKLFKELFKDKFGKDFLLIDKKKYVDGYLGIGKIHPRVDDFVGDFVSISLTNKTLNYKTLDMPFKKPSLASHGGLTEQEMLCPLIVYTC